MASHADIDEELADLRDILRRRNDREPFESYLSLPGDHAAAKRIEIDKKLAALGTDEEADALGDDHLLGLIADFVEYRISLWSDGDGESYEGPFLTDEPIPYALSFPRTPDVTGCGNECCGGECQYEQVPVGEVPVINLTVVQNRAGSPAPTSPIQIKKQSKETSA